MFFKKMILLILFNCLSALNCCVNKGNFPFVNLSECGKKMKFMNSCLSGTILQDYSEILPLINDEGRKILSSLEFVSGDYKFLDSLGFLNLHTWWTMIVIHSNSTCKTLRDYVSILIYILFSEKIIYKTFRFYLGYENLDKVMNSSFKNLDDIMNAINCCSEITNQQKDELKVLCLMVENLLCGKSIEKEKQYFSKLDQKQYKHLQYVYYQKECTQKKHEFFIKSGFFDENFKGKIYTPICFSDKEKVLHLKKLQAENKVLHLKGPSLNYLWFVIPISLILLLKFVMVIKEPR